ncbi:MAG: PaaI family thioesterase [Anaerolineae bacterium]|nr:PaaI family thioesterase [Anaerolineae bacterium]
MAGQDENKKKIWLAEIKKMTRTTMMGTLNIEIVEIDDEHIELIMPITVQVKQPVGLLHGGASMVMAETAASVHAAWLTDLSKFVPVGIEISGSHLSSAREGHVRATARVFQQNWDALIVHEIEINHVETGSLLCKARVTNHYKPI